MSTNDYIRYMTKALLQHLETPKEERKQLRKERKETKMPLLTEWFGIIPLAISLLFKKKRSK